MNITISKLASFIATDYLKKQGQEPRFGASALDFVTQGFVPNEIAKRGEIGEELVANIIKEHGHTIERQKKVKLNINEDVLYGSIDIYVIDDPTIIEVKTTNQYNTLAYYNAVAQAVLYAVTFPKPPKILIAHVSSNKHIAKTGETISVLYTIEKIDFRSPEQALIDYTLANYKKIYHRLKGFIKDLNRLLELYNLW